MFPFRFLTVGASRREARRRKSVAFAIDQSDERRRNLIRDWYRLYLQREATLSEVEQYLNRLQRGQSQRTVQRSIIDDPEYVTKPNLPAPGVVARLI